MLSKIKKLYFWRKKEPKKLMLFIDGDVPMYDKAAGAFIVFEYLKIFLKNNFQIIFWSYNQTKIQPYVRTLQRMGIKVYCEGSFKEFIEKWGKNIDISIICRPAIAKKYLNMIRDNSKGKIIYNTIDLHYLREMRAAKILKDKKKEEMSLETKRLELDIIKKADLSLFFSNEEVRIIKTEDQDLKTVVIPWVQGIKNNKKRAFKERKGLLFLGGFSHLPNGDAIKWFCQFVFPLIKKEIPEIKLTIIGSDIGSDIKELRSKSIKVLGFIRQTDTYFDKAKVFVAPLRFGAGFKGKIALSQAHGLPVVTTLIGAEGTRLLNRKNVLVANEAGEFAEKVIEIYKNEKMWNTVSRNSLRYVKKNYSSKKAEKVIMKIINTQL